MSGLEFTGLFVAERQLVIKQAIDFGIAGLALDFDGTCTISTKQSASHWEIISSLCTVESQRERQKILAKYLPPMNNGTLSEKDARDFIREDYRIFQQSGITLADLDKAVKLAEPRPGLRELFSLFATKNICIISYGMTNFIEKFLTNYNLPKVKIYANQFKFSDVTGKLTGLDECFITPGNKNCYLENFALSRNISPNHLVVLVNSFACDKTMLIAETLKVYVKSHIIENCHNNNIDVIVHSGNLVDLLNFLNPTQT